MIDEWHFNVSNYGKVRVSLNLIEKISKYRQKKIEDHEAGGCLIGKRLNSGGALLVNCFTQPQPTDKRGRRFFYRSKAHNSIVQKIWKQTNHHSTYVGLWHTHPEPVPKYSSTDKSDWLTALSESEYEDGMLLFFIAGLTHMGCWAGRKKFWGHKIILVGEWKFE